MIRIAETALDTRTVAYSDRWSVGASQSSRMTRIFSGSRVCRRVGFRAPFRVSVLRPLLITFRTSFRHTFAINIQNLLLSNLTSQYCSTRPHCEPACLRIAEQRAD